MVCSAVPSVRRIAHVGKKARSGHAAIPSGWRDALCGLCRPEGARSRSRSGEVNEASIFIAVLGASNYPFAEATWRQSLSDWIGSQRNRTYEALAQHHGVAVVPALRPLPATPYEYAEWKLVHVNIDDHVEIEGHYYSVPYTLVKQQLEARISAQTIELFHKGKRLASHRRSQQKGRYTTVSTHMPQAHRHYAHWTPQRLIRWAAKAGEATARVVETILTSRAHPQQGFRSCLGLMRLGRRFGDDRLEAACRRALAIGACSYKSIASMLTHDLDRRPCPTTLGQTR
jgi:transposase